jgi:small neutral amino acid transporter SnatA (MarC family)
MGKIILATLLVLLVVLVGGGVFLAFWDIPAPSTTVEKVIPHARFAK